MYEEQEKRIKELVSKKEIRVKKSFERFKKD